MDSKDSSSHDNVDKPKQNDSDENENDSVQDEEDDKPVTSKQDDDEPGQSKQEEEKTERSGGSKSSEATSAQKLPGQVAQFRPHRLDPTKEDEVEVQDGEENEVAGFTQVHKPSSSAYAMLEEMDSASISKASSMHPGLDAYEDTMDAVGSELSANISPVVVNAEPTPRKRRWRKFRKYVYNIETNAYCNRTKTSWCLICTFYFWIMVAFLAMFMIFVLSFQWRDTNTSPAFLKLTVMSDPNPALAVVPLDITHGDMIIWYKNSGKGTPRFQTYVKLISDFLDHQELICDQQLLIKQECHFNRSELGPCSNGSYGYNQNQPCIFLKLNNLLTWMPTPILRLHLIDSTISQELADKIQEETPRHSVYVDCRGETQYDQQNLGPIQYYPEPVFDSKFFPSTKETKTNPIIAIKLNNAKVGHLLQIHCTLLAGNIKNKANSNIKFILYMN